jgi:hypothetical protein
MINKHEHLIYLPPTHKSRTITTYTTSFEKTIQYLIITPLCLRWLLMRSVSSYTIIHTTIFHDISNLSSSIIYPMLGYGFYHKYIEKLPPDEPFFLMTDDPVTQRYFQEVRKKREKKRERKREKEREKQRDA